MSRSQPPKRREWSEQPENDRTVLSPLPFPGWSLICFHVLKQLPEPVLLYRPHSWAFARAALHEAWIWLNCRCATGPLLFKSQCRSLAGAARSYPKRWNSAELFSLISWNNTIIFTISGQDILVPSDKKRFLFPSDPFSVLSRLPSSWNPRWNRMRRTTTFCPSGNTFCLHIVRIHKINFGFFTFYSWQVYKICVILCARFMKRFIFQFLPERDVYLHFFFSLFSIFFSCLVWNVSWFYRLHAAFLIKSRFSPLYRTGGALRPAYDTARFPCRTD